MSNLPFQRFTDARLISPSVDSIQLGVWEGSHYGTSHSYCSIGTAGFDRLVALVVKAFASIAVDPGFESSWEFFQVD